MLELCPHGCAATNSVLQLRAHAIESVIGELESIPITTSQMQFLRFTGPAPQMAAPPPNFRASGQ